MRSDELRKCWRRACEHGGDVNGVGVEFGAGGMAEGGGDDDGVALEARDHVQMNVEDILAGCFAVGEEEIDTFAAQAGTA